MPPEGNKLLVALSQALSLVKGLYFRYPQFVIPVAVLFLTGLGGAAYIGMKYMLDASGSPHSGIPTPSGTNYTNDGGSLNSSGNSAGKNSSNSKNPKSGSTAKNGSSSNSTSSSSNSGSSSGGGGSSSGGSSGGGSSGGSQTFESISGFARPDPGTPSAASADGWRLVPFTDKTGLTNAISGMQPHDYIYYAGSGVLTISSSGSSNAYTIHDLNPSSPVVFDFGAARDIWNPSMVTSNYVKFAYTGTSQYEGLYLYNLSNIRIFGGEYNTGQYGNNAIRLMGSDSNVYIMDAYGSMSGGNGISVQPVDHSTGAALSITNFTVRAEFNRFCMNPAWDSHADKGTGCHGAILHGNSGTLSNSTFAIYAHDPLQPGETSAGKTWPEGAGGSALEPGMDTGGVNANDTFYVKGENMLMIPNGTNPGSTGAQTGGNVIDAWGNAPFDNFDFKWIEGINMSGAVFHGTGGSWYPGTPPILVEHGRHSNTNQTSVGQSQSVPYYAGYGITYDDCL